MQCNERLAQKNTESTDSIANFICVWTELYETFAKAVDKKNRESMMLKSFMPALDRHMYSTVESVSRNGFHRIARCREALNALDHCGWQRSFHQRQFHESYIRACSQVFFKTDPAGTFMREQKKLLELNGWDRIQQEVLVSTPRRFGKTVSISMFAAAIIFSCPSVECSIYSTCKRISTKLLRKVVDYLNLIHHHLKIPKMKEIRANQEEIVLQGPEGSQDVRIMNSYPSKVSFNHSPPHLTDPFLVDILHTNVKNKYLQFLLSTNIRTSIKSNFNHGWFVVFHFVFVLDGAGLWIIH